MVAVSPSLRQEVEDFLFREARLLDEQRYEEWLQLFAEDFRYHIPCNTLDCDPEAQVSIAFDDRPRMTARIWRLLNSDAAFAQMPPSRTTRTINNVEVHPQEDGALQVYSKFLMIEVRRGRQNIFGGMLEHHLVRQSGDLKIAYKRIGLVNNDLAIDNLTFLL